MRQCWRIIAYSIIEKARDDSWIKDGKYSDSIRKFIGKAVADCITDMGKFADKPYDEVVVFDATPEDIEYTPENWNAVVLWNYLNVLKWMYIEANKQNPDERYFKKDPFEVVREHVIGHYGENLSNRCIRRQSR